MKDGFRHEYKYLISASAAELLRLQLPHLLARDPYTGPTGQYTIRSLYFDTLGGAALEEKRSGLRDRIKYRIRAYNYDFSHLKLEKKEKHGSLSKKTAQSITEADAASLQAMAPDRCPDTPYGLTDELRLAILGRSVRPRVLVDYDRTPFVSPLGNTRITLDENLRTRIACWDLQASHAAMIPVLSPDQAILEVKFDDFLPAAVVALLNTIPKTNMAISKFALCMELTYDRREGNPL